jgi:hypothetical protein
MGNGERAYEKPGVENIPEQSGVEFSALSANAQSLFCKPTDSRGRNAGEKIDNRYPLSVHWVTEERVGTLIERHHLVIWLSPAT